MESKSNIEEKLCCSGTRYIHRRFPEGPAARASRYNALAGKFPGAVALQDDLVSTHIHAGHPEVNAKLSLSRVTLITTAKSRGRIAFTGFGVISRITS